MYEKLANLENIEIGFKAGLVDAMMDSHDMWKPIYNYFDQLLDVIKDLRDQVQKLEDETNGVKEVKVVEEES